MQTAQSRQIQLHADFGELFSPVTARIFSIVHSSTNCLNSDRVMSVTYLPKYAAGVEEHASVDISGQ